MTQTEQLLRRMTGSIAEYINTVGKRPLRMSDYDKAVLAIRDGDSEGGAQMEKVEIKLTFDSERMDIRLFYLKKEDTDVQRKMDEVLM